MPLPLGAYVLTTNVWDVSSLGEKDASLQLKELLLRLYQNINNISNVLNVKDTGFYDNTRPVLNQQRFFPNPALSSQTEALPIFREVFRLVVNFGALPNAGSKSVAHNIPISIAYSFTRIYATASDMIGLNYIPIPYASPTLINNIEISVNATDVTITTGSDRTNFTTTYVILEYITT
jgi:hypothetical protein